MFRVNDQYTKEDIYRLLRVPEESQRGAWDTGYRMWKGDMYIFANVGSAGRTGVDYKNFWDGDELMWHTKPNGQQLKELLSNNVAKHLFTRSNDRDPFNYEGQVIAQKYFDQTPKRILWAFIVERNQRRVETLPEEIRGSYLEGTFKVIKVNKYERNVDARRQCIRHYGCHCQVCDFDFSVYRRIGEGYIHVHHLVLISTIGKEYEVDPISDLRPVCANCHAMIHMRNPPYSIEELRDILK